MGKRCTSARYRCAAGCASRGLPIAECPSDGADNSVDVGSQRVQLDPSTLDRRPALRNYDGKPVVLGIRPEDLEDAEIATTAAPERRIKGRVRLIEALGSELMVHLELDGARRVDSGDPDAPQELSTTGVANAVVTPALFERDRLVITQSSALAITGRLQNVEGVIHIMAEAFTPLTLAEIPEGASHDFR